MPVKSDSYLEIEAKLWVEDLAALEARIRSEGGSLRAARVFERNVRFEDAGHTLTPNGIVLRLRQDSGARLTYKAPASSALEPHPEALQVRFEAEVTVSDFDTMHTILQRLGFQPVMIYEKYRTTYALNGVDIALDEMPYGSFVELEGTPEAIEQVVAALGLSLCRRFGESYALLFEYVCANLGLTFHDLTFANFEGVAVPLAAFAPPGEYKPS